MITSLISRFKKKIFLQKSKQDAQLSQRDRAAGCVIVLAKDGRLELGGNILQTYVYL